MSREHQIFSILVTVAIVGLLLGSTWIVLSGAALLYTVVCSWIVGLSVAKLLISCTAYSTNVQLYHIHTFISTVILVLLTVYGGMLYNLNSAVVDTSTVQLVYIVLASITGIITLSTFFKSIVQGTTKMNVRMRVVLKVLASLMSVALAWSVPITSWLGYSWLAMIGVYVNVLLLSSMLLFCSILLLKPTHTPFHNLIAEADDLPEEDTESVSSEENTGLTYNSHKQIVKSTLLYSILTACTIIAGIATTLVFFPHITSMNTRLLHM